MHIRQPSWAYTLTTYLLLLYTIKLIFDPITPLWGMLAPVPYAAWRLSNAYAVTPLAPNGCYSIAAGSWRQIAGDSRASSWFQAVYREARTPSARVAALAGLQVSDPAAFARLRRYPVSRPEAVLPVEMGDRIGPVSVDEVLDSLDSGALARSLWASAMWPEC